MPNAQGSDSTGMTPYDIDGYDWELKDVKTVDKGTLLPGECEEVYEVKREAGLNLSGDTRHLLTIMVDDGSLTWMAPFNGDRDQINDAMRERACVQGVPTEGEVWTLVEE